MGKYRYIRFKQPNYKKKELEKLFHISDTTVSRTIEACGLNTSDRIYSIDQIKGQFLTARKLFEMGYTTKKVKRHFQG